MFIGFQSENPSATNRAHRKHLVAPAQATHRSRVRRGEEGDRAPQWLATTAMLPPPNSSSMATDRPQTLWI